MAKYNMDNFMATFKRSFFLTEKEIEVLHKEYTKELNLAIKKNKGIEPKKFIQDLINYMLENEFDANFIRAIFGLPSQKMPVYREEIAQFENIFLTQMLKK